AAVELREGGLRERRPVGASPLGEQRREVEAGVVGDLGVRGHPRALQELVEEVEEIAGGSDLMLQADLLLGWTRRRGTPGGVDAPGAVANLAPRRRWSPGDGAPRRIFPSVVSNPVSSASRCLVPETSRGASAMNV